MAERAILALGGNLGDRKATIKSAIKSIREIDGVELIAKSPLVESFAATEDGPDESAPRYLNGVIEIETTLKPGVLLTKLREIETEHGRVRLTRWGSRTLDIDIITYGTLIKDGKRLTIPHPRAYERAFVVVPWAQMDPNARLLGHGSVAALAEDLKSQVWNTK
jgi:2-amino-4-hydroxy-6-hydroxymethyldihydropteridine diphosphokinase